MLVGLAQGELTIFTCTLFLLVLHTSGEAERRPAACWNAGLLNEQASFFDRDAAGLLLTLRGSVSLSFHPPQAPALELETT